MDIEDDIVKLLFDLTEKNNRNESDYYLCADKMMDICRDYGWMSPEQIAKEQDMNNVVTEEWLREKGWKSPEDYKAEFMIGFDEWIREHNRGKI